METSLQRYYDGSPITFNVGNTETMVNATEMSKPFNRKPNDWLKTQQATNYLNALSKAKNFALGELVKINKGGEFSGTWINEDVALEFARWLSPDFGIWCNDQIKEMLKTGVAAVNKDILQEYRKIQQLNEAKANRLFWARKVRHLNEDIAEIRDRRFSSAVPGYKSLEMAENKALQASLF